MATRSRAYGNSGSLAEAGAFARRRAIELLGTGLLAGAFGAFLSLASYDPADPSFNNATRAVPNNLLGRPGAAAADLLYATMGHAAWLIGIVVLAWGWRLFADHALPRFWLRITALPIALLGGSIALAGAGAPLDQSVAFGGLTGSIFLADLMAAGERLAIDPPAIAAAAAAVAGAATLAALGLTAAEWRAIGRSASWTARRGATAGVVCGRLIARIARRETVTGDAKEAEPHRKSRREPRLDDEAAESRRREQGDVPLQAERGPLVVAKPARAASQRGPAPRQRRLELGDEDAYELPSTDLLGAPPRRDASIDVNPEALEQNARLLETVLDDFGVRGEIVKVRPGPVVTLYELEPAPGTKSSRVIGLADDMARSMSAVSVRVALVPGRNVMGIELPNTTRELVTLRELLESSDYERFGGELTLVLGKDIGGAPVVVDLAKMPHLLIAGTTGSGKSVAINTMILSLLYRLTPEQCRLIMIDPKMLELSVYDGIPHLLTPVVTDPNKAVVALRWAVREMESRYRAISNLGVRSIAGYNARIAEARRKGEILTRTVQTGFDAETGAPRYEDQPLDMSPLPLIVIIVDEMADLMLVAGKDVEAAVQRLAQMARAAGIHLIMATQRPSVDVITGTIKANFPTRVSFQVTSKIDSRTILGDSGAEQLLGQGDMLYMAGGGRIVRVHGPFVSDGEVERVVTFLKDQGEPDYIDDVTEVDETGEYFSFGTGGTGEDELYDQAVALVCRERKASTSFVQRHLQIGYNRAARLIERMEAEGVISQANHVGKREVLAQDVPRR
jgi:S-DNA-T family DNA segregation ATPase FtsK/SpoIIIE